MNWIVALMIVGIGCDAYLFAVSHSWLFVAAAVLKATSATIELWLKA